MSSPAQRTRRTVFAVAVYAGIAAFLVWCQQTYLLVSLCLLWTGILLGHIVIPGLGRHPTYFKKATVSVALTCLLVSLIELLSAQVTTLPGDTAVKHWRLNHSWRPYKVDVKPTTYTGITEPGYPPHHTHTYNDQGWIEDYDVTLTAPPNVFRIFYVGDSFTEGVCPSDQSVPNHVERLLNDKYADQDLQIEVINTGTTSYSPTLVYLLVRFYLLQYSPDLIVFNVDMTDVHDDVKYSKTLLWGDDGKPLACPPKSRPGLNTDNAMGLLLYEYSYTYNAALYFSGRKRGSDEVLDKDVYFAWCKHEWDAKTEKSVKYSARILRYLCDLCTDHDVPLVLTSVPHYQQYRSHESEETPLWTNKPHHIVAEIAKEGGASYFDSWSALKPHIEFSERDTFYYTTNMHFNPRGNRIWADAHYRALCDPKLGLLP